MTPPTRLKVLDNALDRTFCARVDKLLAQTIDFHHGGLNKTGKEPFTLEEVQNAAKKVQEYEQEVAFFKHYYSPCITAFYSKLQKRKHEEEEEKKQKDA